MLTRVKALAILAFVGTAVAMPQPTQVARGAALQGQTTQYVDEDSGPVAHNGALDIAFKLAKGEELDLSNQPSATTSSGPEPTQAPDLAERADEVARLHARAPERYTISVVNKLPYAIRTAHVLGRDQNNNPFPDLVAGNRGQGVIGQGGSDYFVIPKNWAGNMAVVQEGGGRRVDTGKESKIEGSFKDQGQWGGWKFDINVSYVDGFSLPVVCSCDGNVIGGCNVDLWVRNKCPNDPGFGSCVNPNANAGSAHPFFAPCAHAAYTYASDDAANTGNGVCSGDTVSCCIGWDCVRNPRQP